MDKNKKYVAAEKYNMLIDMVEKMADDAGADYEKAREVAEEVFYNHCSVEERKYIKELYESEKETVRQEAIEYQDRLFGGETDLDEDCVAEDYFRKAGRRYELTEEFSENAVISKRPGYNLAFAD